MRLSSRHKKLLGLVILSLLLGFLNYLLYQPHIALFSFVHGLPAKPYFLQNTWLRHFMTGHFSDIAWCCSLYLVTVMLSELNRLHFSTKWLILLFPFILETVQYFRIIGGTFDWYDMLTYLIILLIFLKLFPILKFIHHEEH